MNLIPIDNRMIVRRIENRHKTALVMITDAPPEQLVEVLAVGPGKYSKNGKRKPLEVKVGDIVLIPGVANLYPDYSIDDEFMITEEDVAGIVQLGEVN